ncbi:hypothetical protein SAMN05216303_107128 [Rhodoferax sp. OV413]|nr:hypothetical protein SAMN05216303_107128 [Rhodoferax sp. OV413]
MNDARSLPPAQRVFTSPSATFELVLSSPSQGQTAQAELFAVAAGARRPLWRQALPHEQGPRTAVVADSGEVVLLDEWINVPSRHALLLLDPQGRRRAHYNFDELVGILQLPRKTVAQHAVQGAWLAGEPRLTTDGRLLLLPAGGRTLSLQLADGRLTAY